MKRKLLIIFILGTFTSCVTNLPYKFEEHYINNNRIVLTYKNNTGELITKTSRLKKDSGDNLYFFLDKKKVLFVPPDTKVDKFLDSTFAEMLNFPSSGYSTYPKYRLNILVDVNGQVKHCGTSVINSDILQKAYNEELHRLILELKAVKINILEPPQGYLFDYSYDLDMVKIRNTHSE